MMIDCMIKAVRGGFEPPHCNSKKDNLLELVVNPYLFSILYSVPPRRGGVSACPRDFHHLTISKKRSRIYILNRGHYVQKDLNTE